MKSIGIISLISWFAFSLNVFAAVPQAIIQANQNNGPLTISSSDVLSINLSLDPGDQLEQLADWWFYAQTSNGQLSYNVSNKLWENGLKTSYQGKLIEIKNFDIVSYINLPTGIYTLNFAVDTIQNGQLDQTNYNDHVEISVQDNNGKYNLGLAPSYEIGFDENFDYISLAQDGFKRLNLYFTWKEFEFALDNPDDPNGTTLEELDTLINKISNQGFKLALIIELTDTDCSENATETCWTQFGLENKFTTPNFVGFDNNNLRSDLENFLVTLAQRYPPTQVSHIFIGNETDQFLKLFPQYQNGWLTLMNNLKTKIKTLNIAPKFGTIFTFVPDSLNSEYNKLAKQVVPMVDTMAFTVYPYLAYLDSEQPVEVSEARIKTWFDGANSVVGGKPWVITETAHPADGTWGTLELQTSYAQLLLDYLKTTQAPIEFITWWCIEDANTHPDESFRHTGLLTNLLSNGGSKRSAYDLWRNASQ